MPPFLTADSLTALGWSLLNSIWQTGILWIGYLLITGNHQRFSAAARHNLALFFSCLGSIWFLCSLFCKWVYPNQISGSEPVSYFFSAFSSFMPSLLSALTVIYLTVLVFRGARYLFGFYQMKLGRRSAEVRLSEPFQLFSNRISRAMGIGKQISIRLVDWVDTAQTVGFFKPLIFLPIALVNQLSMEQVETILLHELQHIRRNDYLINILMTLCHTIFFFNPFARCFFKTVAKEREHACDDAVLQWDYPASVYAGALFTLEKFRQQPHSFSLAANGNNPRLLKERICRVVGEPASVKSPFSRLLTFSMIAALLIFTVNSFSRFPEAHTGTPPHVHTTAVISTSFVPVVAKTAGPIIQGNGIVDRNEPADKVNEPVVKPTKTLPLKTKYQNPVLVINDPAILVKLDEEKVKDQVRYADHNELRNYSNQKAPEPELPVVANLDGVPYIPSASFSYQPVSDTLQLDLLLQNKMKALAVMGEIKAAELQAKLKEEIGMKMKDLRQLEKENRKLLEQKQKDLQPALLKMKEDMQRKKEEIHRLRVQLQIQDGEIIFI